jgi:hypothetical protein
VILKSYISAEAGEVQRFTVVLWWLRRVEEMNLRSLEDAEFLARLSGEELSRLS